MDITGDLIEIVKLIIPAAAVIIAVQYTIKAFLQKELRRNQVEVKVKKVEITSKKANKIIKRKK